ncbi:hypothetical protein SynA18461_01825 [Synechococcus sp. A18-46.1]|nr:hypothetical protein SynA18461_01825 [Synechococcus sp. A18-46.1]
MLIEIPGYSLLGCERIRPNPGRRCRKGRHVFSRRCADDRHAFASRTVSPSSAG